MNILRRCAALAVLISGCLAMSGCSAVTTDGEAVGEAANTAGPLVIESQANPAQQATLASLCGSVERQRTVKHPTLGYVTVGLRAVGDSGPGTGCIGIVDSSGNALLRQGVAVYGDALDFADPPIDATNNIFITYNPGRYNGVVTVVPTATGYADIGWGESDGQYQSTTHAYYSAELVGPGSDGRYTINSSANDCEPSCAGGTVTTTELRWNGYTYS